MDHMPMQERELSAAEVALANTNIDKLVQPANPKFQFIDERLTFEDHPVFFQVLRMEKSLFVWVGSIPPVMNLLQFTIPTALDSEPASTSVFGSKGQTAGHSISTKLAKKTSCSVLISYNLSDTIPGIKEFVERKIFAAVTSPSELSQS